MRPHSHFPVFSHLPVFSTFCRCDGDLQIRPAKCGKHRKMRQPYENIIGKNIFLRKKRNCAELENDGELAASAMFLFRRSGLYFSFGLHFIFRNNNRYQFNLQMMINSLFTHKMPDSMIRSDILFKSNSFCSI